MTDKDNITLPREVGELIENLMHHAYNDGVKQLKYRSSQTVEAEEALRTALAAEQPKQEPVALAKDWLKMTLRVNRGDRVFLIERFLHLSEIKQSHFPLVPETADSAWQELNAAMEGDKT